MGIAREHARRIDAAAARPGLDVLVCDTTPLMVAVYSDLLFDDRSLEPMRARCQQRMDITLLTRWTCPGWPTACSATARTCAGPWTRACARA